MIKKNTSIRFVLFGLLLLAGFNLLSCKKDKEPAKPGESVKTENAVSLNFRNSTLYVGDTLTLSPEFSANAPHPSGYSWKVGEAGIVELSVNRDSSATIIASGAGVVKVFLTAADDVLLDSCKIQVYAIPDLDDGVTKILAIGNSFSEDALEHFVNGLAKAAGKRIVIGNMYIGGSNLALHQQNAENDAAVYSYRKIDAQGNRVVLENTSIAMAVADEQWDYISFQQVSQESGQYNTFVTPLPALFDYVKQRATNPEVQYVLHQVWAYAQQSTHPGFVNYNNDQQTMYAAIIDAYNQAKTLIGADLIVPDGTAIQNGRTSYVGDNLNRDGYHLNALGQYIVSCTWFEALFGQSVIGNRYRPEGLSDYQVEMAQHAADKAIAHPDGVTQLTDYVSNPAANLSNPVLINVGKNNIAGWNTLASSAAGASLLNLLDNQGQNTGIMLTLTEAFNGINENGAAGTTTGFNMPAEVSSNSFFGNPWGEFGGKIVRQSVLVFQGLDPGHTYDIGFFASRNGVADNRETAFGLKGGNEQTVYLDAANNADRTVTAEAVRPDAQGRVVLTVTAGPHNTNGVGFYYLGAVRLTLSE